MTPTQVCDRLTERDPLHTTKLKWVGRKGNSDVQWRQEAASRTPTTNTPFRYAEQQHMLVGGKCHMHHDNMSVKPAGNT